jgi:hypothetical protein
MSGILKEWSQNGTLPAEQPTWLALETISQVVSKSVEHWARTKSGSADN